DLFERETLQRPYPSAPALQSDLQRRYALPKDEFTTAARGDPKVKGDGGSTYVSYPPRPSRT
ncbi:Uncharacterized protein DAT39_001373, partial [Clarias magur]